MIIIGILATLTYISSAGIIRKVLALIENSAEFQAYEILIVNSNVWEPAYFTVLVYLWNICLCLLYSASSPMCVTFST